MTDAYNALIKEYATLVGEALNALRDDLDRGGEYPDAEWRASRKFSVKAKDLREAYDEFTGVTQ